VSFFVTVQS